jgi:hypothetical protein
MADPLPPLNGIVQKMIDAGESEENIATVIQHYQANSGANSQTTSPDTYGTGALIAGAAKGASGALSDTANAALKYALTPASALRVAPETGSAIGQGVTILGGLGTAATAAATGHPIEAGTVLLNTGPAAYFAGRGGWHTAKLANRLMPPAEAAVKQGALNLALNPVTPYLQSALKAVSAVGGAQGVNDLAQMAEPGRQDIGVLGVGPSASADTITPEAEKQIMYRVNQRLKNGESPYNALVAESGNSAAIANRIMSRFIESGPNIASTPTSNPSTAQVQAVQSLIDTKGLSPSAAIKSVTGGDDRLFGPLMTAYMRSRIKP